MIPPALCRLFAAWLTLAAAGAYGNSVPTILFEFKDGKSSFLSEGGVFASWNPDDALRVLSPGLKVMFFGSAVNCTPRAANGPVSDHGNSRFSQALELTGVPAPSSRQDVKRWTPSADSDQCRKSAHDDFGDSFAHLNQEGKLGGIGLLTFTGPDDHGKESFFRQYDENGRRGTGVNAHIEATFVAFRFDWKAADSIKPWTNPNRPSVPSVAEFATVQTIATVSVDDASYQGKVVQAQQEMILALINPFCVRSLGMKRGTCVVQFVFNVAVFRSGVTDWSQEKWYRTGLFFDSAQGGIPVIHGPIGHKGDVAVHEPSGFELYSSTGSPSSHTLFKEKEFGVRISFEQFMNALKIVAAKKLGKSPKEVASPDLNVIFGLNWHSPLEWSVATVNIGQEIFNPDRSHRAYIGGSIKEIAVRAVMTE